MQYGHMLDLDEPWKYNAKWKESVVKTTYPIGGFHSYKKDKHKQT